MVEEHAGLRVLMVGSAGDNDYKSISCLEGGTINFHTFSATKNCEVKQCNSKEYLSEYLKDVEFTVVASNLENDDVLKLTSRISELSMKKCEFTILVHVESYKTKHDEKLVKSRLKNIKNSVSAVVLVKESILSNFAVDDDSDSKTSCVNEAYYEAVYALVAPLVRCFYIGYDFTDHLAVFSPKRSRRGNLFLFGFGKGKRGEGKMAVDRAIDSLGLEPSFLRSSFSSLRLLTGAEALLSPEDYDYAEDKCERLTCEEHVGSRTISITPEKSDELTFTWIVCTSLNTA